MDDLPPPRGAAVIEVDQNGNRLLDNGVRALPFHLTHKADATGVVFELLVVESLLLRCAVDGHLFLP